jgi:hypothetical protein
MASIAALTTVPNTEMASNNVTPMSAKAIVRIDFFELDEVETRNGASARVTVVAKATFTPF